MSIESVRTGRHYVWGGNCDGWHLAATPNLSVIQERVPKGSPEVRHLHHRAEQFFYVLSGVATLEVAGVIHLLRPSEGFHVAPGRTSRLEQSARTGSRVPGDFHTAQPWRPGKCMTGRHPP